MSDVGGLVEEEPCMVCTSCISLYQAGSFRIFIKGGDHCNGPKCKGVFGNLFQPNNASKSMYCVSIVNSVHIEG